MIDLQSFIDWQRADKDNRVVKIEIYRYTPDVKAWVYDHSLMQGQLVSTVDEIDLVAEQKRYLERKIRELEALNKKETCTEQAK